MIIFLIGFMGAGKTTLGCALGEKLPDYRYIDLDEEIERTVGSSISRFFADHGEAEFRKIERKMLENLCRPRSTTMAEPGASTNLIIGCGGGTPCFFDNMAYMNANGVTILLQADTATLLRRLLQAQAQRPKLNGMSPAELEQYIVSAQRERAPYYLQARARFNSNKLESVAEIEETCNLFIQMFIPENSEL